VLKEMAPSRIEECIHEAAASPMADAAVEYPTWYLQRWHFLPEGYLSRRSISLYERLIRRIYNVGLEGRLHAALTTALRTHIPQSLLEVGSGPGNLLRAVHDALPGTRLSGVDLSPFMLEAAQARLPADVRLLHADARSLPIEDASVDAVVSQHVLGHLPGAAASGAWREAARILRPGGRVYLLEHAWHRRLPGKLKPVLRRPLLGGLVHLEAFEKVA
jgi:ubiquinone/menaquinone biosynthesis C-methylase UbiE